MNKSKKTAACAVTDNPLLRYAKVYIRNMPRPTKIIFFLKYIKYSLNIRDYEAAKDGLHQLCVLFPELKADLAIANRTYLGDDEGERIAMLFKHAFGKVKSAGKRSL